MPHCLTTAARGASMATVVKLAGGRSRDDARRRGVIALCRREPRHTLRRRGFRPCQSRRPHCVLADLPPLGSRIGEAREGDVAEPAATTTVIAPSPEMNPTEERGKPPETPLELPLQSETAAVQPAAAVVVTHCEWLQEKLFWPPKPHRSFSPFLSPENFATVAGELFRRRGWNSSPLPLEVAAGLPPSRFGDRRYVGSAVPPSVRVVETVAKVAGS